MSELLPAFAGAERVSAFAAPPPVAFRPWAERLRPAPARPQPARAPEPEPLPVSMKPVVDPEAIARTAYERGYAEGQRDAAAALDGDIRAVAALAAALPGIEPEPPAQLAELLAATVDRLVRQIVGEAAFDRALLAERALAAAALIGDTGAPARMRLHPEDATLLEGMVGEMALVADPMRPRGSIVVETADGWIEDGPEAGLEKLRAAIERVAAR